MALIIVDFDGTIVKERYPGIGKPNKVVCWCLRKLQRKHKLILFTSREDQTHEHEVCEDSLLEDAIKTCTNLGIYFIEHNSQCQKRVRKYGYDCRKITGDYYIDDRANASVTVRALWLWFKLNVLRLR